MKKEFLDYLYSGKAQIEECLKNTYKDLSLSVELYDKASAEVEIKELKESLKSIDNIILKYVELHK